jgi:putative transposase
MPIGVRKHHTPEQKAQVVLELLKEEKTLSQLASEHGIHHSLLVRWKKQAIESLPKVFAPDNREHDLKASYEKQMEGLYQEIGRLSTQITWLKKKSGMS